MVFSSLIQSRSIYVQNTLVLPALVGAESTLPAAAKPTGLLHELPDLLTVVVLAAFLVILMLIVLSMIIAARRIVMTSLQRKARKTRYVDAWKIAGQRLESDMPPPPDPKQN
jgi:hypothetical protein